MESCAFILTSTTSLTLFLSLSLRLYSITAPDRHLNTEEIANVNNARSNKALKFIQNKLGWKENDQF